jgi:hypothetical protein
MNSFSSDNLDIHGYYHPFKSSSTHEELVECLPDISMDVKISRNPS